MSNLAEDRSFITPAEYYEMERTATEKHDYYQGEIFAMSGGTSNHSRIKTDMLVEIGLQLKGKQCQPYDSDQRLKILATGLRTYPDTSIYCDELEYDEEDEQKETATNPTVLIEVLSDSTEAYDRGLKAENYRQTETLQAYLLVSQNAPHVEMFERTDGDDWRFTEVRGIDAEMTINSIEVTLKLAEIYRRVKFKDQAEPTPASSSDSAAPTT